MNDPNASPPVPIPSLRAYLPHFAQFQVLGALQRRNLYSGTVPAHVIAVRRRRNKAARAARRLNRSR